MNYPPPQVKIFNQVISVVVDNEFCQMNNCLGQSDFNHNKIIICTKYDGEAIPAERVWSTFYHEMTHLFMKFISMEELANEETLTDNLAQVIRDFVRNNYVNLNES